MYYNMSITIDLEDFINLYRVYDKKSFSEDGLELIFNILNELGNEITFDYVAIRGAFNEYESIEEAKKELGDELEDYHYEVHSEGAVIVLVGAL